MCFGGTAEERAYNSSLSLARLLFWGCRNVTPHPKPGVDGGVDKAIAHAPFTTITVTLVHDRQETGGTRLTKHNKRRNTSHRAATHTKAAEVEGSTHKVSGRRSRPPDRCFGAFADGRDPELEPFGVFPSLPGPVLEAPGVLSSLPPEGVLPSLASFVLSGVALPSLDLEGVGLPSLVLDGVP